MKNIIYIGYVVSKNSANSFSGISVAGNKMQWNIIHHLWKNSDLSIKCITICPIAPYPHDEKLFVKESIIQVDQDITSIAIAFCNLPVIKQISQIRNVYKKARSLIDNGQECIILGFNLFPQVGIPMRLLQRRYPNVECVSILADLPIDDKNERRLPSKILRKVFDYSTKKSISKCGNFIILNEYVGETYLSDKKYVVVEGGVDEELIEKYTSTQSLYNHEKKNVVFSGALTEYNGIPNLLDSFHYIDDSITLEIYGDGYLRDSVIAATSRDNRIVYMGKVTNERMLDIQRRAWLLINPRIINNPISRVTFPSKMFEYLLSKRPVLSTNLSAYSDEYRKVMFTCNDSPQSIAEAIIHISKMDEAEIDRIANNAYNFVKNKKTWSKQTEIIKEFIDSI